ncbi:tetratricopeptide repeat protein [Imtechella halotolerans]|nr:hypothetical protein [Imtechella halotolerans]WMQ64161.1 hypothetical protein PT603_04100 [Imtechella halotolerans]
MDKILIEKYFTGKITAEESLEFKKRYISDPEFKQEVDFYKNVKKVAGAVDDENFKVTLQCFESEFSRRRSIRPTDRIRTFIAIAAVFVIGFSIVSLWPTKVSEADLFNTYFEPSKNISIPIIRSEGSQEIITEAFDAYSIKDYEKAASLFEKAFTVHRNPELLFYQANSLLANGQTEYAIEQFKKHLELQEMLTNRSHWYLALAYLKSGNLKETKIALRAYIKTGERFKREEAMSLLESLE